MSDIDSQPEKKRGGATIPLMVIATLLGVLVGGGAGAFAAGPLLAKRVVASMDLVEAGAAGSHGGHGAAAGSASGGAVHRIENLLVNPAQTGGSRLLMLTVALEVADTAQVGTLVTHDAQVRDAIMGVLGQKNVVELVDMQARPALKEEITTAVDSALGAETVKGIFFPVYVLQ